MRLWRRPLEKAALGWGCQYRLPIIYVYVTARGETAKGNITPESVCNSVSFVREYPLTCRLV